MSTTGAAERRTSIGAQRSPASQEAILQAAEEIILEGGLGAFTIEAVARRAKAGKPTIYRWWPSKAALLVGVYQRQKARIATSDTGQLGEDLFLFLKGLVDHWRDGNAGAIYRSVIAEAQSDPQAAEALYVYKTERLRECSDIVVRAQARGDVAGWVDPQMVVETLSSFAWGRLLTGRLALEEAEMRLVVRQLTDGLQAR
jgi:AcrR family transcriptional regulator